MLLSYPFVMDFATALIERLVPKRWRNGDADATVSDEREKPAPEPGPDPDPDSEPAPDGREQPTPPSEIDATDTTAVVPTEIDPSDPEISNEALIIRQLIAHGGRVRRSVLVETTGWSERKLDEVLAEMEADAQISTLQRRDPLVCRRGFEPAGSPLRFKNE